MQHIIPSFVLNNELNIDFYKIDGIYDIGNFALVSSSDNNLSPKISGT